MVHNPIVDDVYWICETTWDIEGVQHILRPYRCKKNMPGGMVAMHRLDDEDSASIEPIHINRLIEMTLVPVNFDRGDI